MSDTPTTTTTPGQITPGNIALHNRPIVHNSDGSISTVRSITIEEDGKAVLIPTVVNGKVVSDDEAIAHYRQTGEHLGVFKSEQAADSYAETLHEDQAAEYLPKANPPKRTQTVSAPGTEIQLDDEFAKLTLSPDLIKLAQATTAQHISARQARALIEDRLSQGLTNRDALDVAKRLAKEIVLSFPGGDKDELMKREVFANLDLRPYLQSAVDSGWVNAGDDSSVRTAGVDRLMVQQQETAREIANDVTTAAGVDPTTQIQNVQRFDTKVIGLAPAAAVSTTQTKVDYGQVAPEDALDAAFDPAGAASRAAVKADPTFPEDELRGITGLPASGLDDAIQAEIDFNTKMKTDNYQRTGIMLSDTPARSVENGGTAPAGRKLSLLGARAYLNDLDVNELTDMQDKLAKAGYYDKIGQGPIKGELNDGATQTAWDLMLVDSFRSNQSITKTMAKRGAEYRNTVIKRNEESMVKNWQGDTIAAANAMALDQIGRRLTDDEVSQVVGMVNGLRKDRQDDIIGVDNMSYQTAQTQAKGFDDSEVQRKVDELVSGERSRNASYDAWQGANDYFGVETPGNPTADKNAPGGRKPIVATQPVTPRTHQSIQFAKEGV